MPERKRSVKELEETGAFRKHPERRREPVLAADLPIGDCPDYLSEPEQAIWEEILTAAPKGTLRLQNRMLIASLCQLEHLSRQNLAKASERTLRLRMMTMLGLCPSPDDVVAEAVEAKSRYQFKTKV